MLGMTSTYKRSDHQIIGGEIGAHIERLAKESGRDLFVVHYEKVGTFCICEWMSPNRDIFIDIMNLGKSLSNFDRSKANEVRLRLFAPLTCDGTSRAIYDADSDYHHMRQDWNEEETERLERVSRGE